MLWVPSSSIDSVGTGRASSSRDLQAIGVVTQFVQGASTGKKPPHTFVAGISMGSIDSSWGGIAGRTDGPDVVNGTVVGAQHHHPESSWEKEDAPGPLIQPSVAGICPEMGEHRTIGSGSYGLGQAWIRRIGFRSVPLI
jgi:hypothetical protein